MFFSCFLLYTLQVLYNNLSFNSSRQSWSGKSMYLGGPRDRHRTSCRFTKLCQTSLSKLRQTENHLFFFEGTWVPWGVTVWQIISGLDSNHGFLILWTACCLESRRPCSPSLATPAVVATDPRTEREGKKASKHTDFWVVHQTKKCFFFFRLIFWIWHDKYQFVYIFSWCPGRCGCWLPLVTQSDVSGDSDSRSCSEVGRRLVVGTSMMGLSRLTVVMQMIIEKTNLYTYTQPFFVFYCMFVTFVVATVPHCHREYFSQTSKANCSRCVACVTKDTQKLPCQRMTSFSCSFSYLIYQNLKCTFKTLGHMP